MNLTPRLLALLGLLTVNAHAEDFSFIPEGLFSFETTSANAQQTSSGQADEALADIEKRYGEAAALLKSAQRKIDQKHRSLLKIRQDIQFYHNEIAKENNALVNQVRSAYLMGQQSKLKLILNQQDPSSSSRMMMYYEYFNKERLTKLAAIEKAIEHLDQLDKQKQAETEILEQALTKKKAEQELFAKFKQQRDRLLLEHAVSDTERFERLKENEQTLKTLMASLVSVDKLINNTSDDVIEPSNETTEDTQAITENVYATSISGKFSDLKGHLPWPVRGKLERKFATMAAKKAQSGVLIEAKEGEDVHAVAKGTVAFAEWMQNYGFLMIIEHNEGFMTLYAFNQSLFKQKNDHVEAGEVIAAVGQSGGQSRPGLYFGIRDKQGLPIDPQTWCRKSK
ncbi:MAG: peptidoglycan DD-metalloendopeptidase family protein [Methylovulum sp.]|nr:peptidoglycan DD-metalloendopeptidase family protein [Methylovulum sp.]